MQVREMHIGVNQWLQKINSKETDSFKPHEIDWALNEEVLRYIKQRTSTNSNAKKQGFESTQKRYDDIEELITSSILPCFYKDSETVFSFLPFNYFRLINDRSLVKDLCNLSLGSIPTTNQTKKICVVPFPDATETSSPYYTSFKIIQQDNSAVLFDIANYITTSTGLNSKEEKFYIINLALEQLNRISPSNIEVRWETFDEEYHANSFVFVISNLPSFTGIILNPSGNIYTSVTKNYLMYNPTPVKEYPNRLTNTEDLYVLLNSVFAGTMVHSPISSLSRGKINVHHRQKFILSFVKIDYIRKPRKIDLFLNQSCELNSNVHEEIVEATARRLSGITKGENYQQLINENLINE